MRLAVSRDLSPGGNAGMARKLERLHAHDGHAAALQQPLVHAPHRR